MSINRRQVVKGVALGAAAIGTDTASAAPAGGKIVHHVFFWLKNPALADRDALIAGLRKLAAVDVVRSLQIGVPASTEQRDVVDSSFHVSELMVFDNVADQQTYQDHPTHKDFIAKCGPLWAKVIVYDMVTV